MDQILGYSSINNIVAEFFMHAELLAQKDYFDVSVALSVEFGILLRLFDDMLHILGLIAFFHVVISFAHLI